MDFKKYTNPVTHPRFSKTYNLKSPLHYSSIQPHQKTTMPFIILNTVSQKTIPNIFDCNLKTNYQILIIFGTNIFNTTCHQRPFSYPPHQNLFLHYLRKTQPAKYHFFYRMRYDCLINITHKNTFCSHFWHFGWQFIQLYIYQLTSKTAWSGGQLCKHRQGDAFSIHWQQYR